MTWTGRLIGAFALCAVFGGAALAEDSSATAEELALGEFLSRDCVSCHQFRQDDRRIGTLFGLSPEAIMERLARHRDAPSGAANMGWVLEDLTPDETRALAVYLASLFPK